MKVKELLNGFPHVCIQGTMEDEVRSIIYDSKEAARGSMFVALCGARNDGHSYCMGAYQAGSRNFLVSKMVQLPPDATIITVEDTREALAYVSCQFFDNPSRKMRMIGITGTKGKTTVTYLIKECLERGGLKIGLIGTIETIFPSEVIANDNTTPESYILQRSLKRMADEGCQVVVMEVSSQGLKMHRTDGILYNIGLFTNLEADHIGAGEHADFEEYKNCKRKLFRQCKIGIFNADDANVQQMIEGATCQVETFGMQNGKWPRLEQKGGRPGISFLVPDCGNEPVFMNTPGSFSMHNGLAAIAVCRHFNISSDIMREALNQAKVKGRMENIHLSDEFSLFIDYAHNAMSLRSLLTTLREYHPKRLICLFGCGGNRSKDRRYEMGEVSGRLADFTIITSDNPRYENPMEIMKDIQTGIDRTTGKYCMIEDRREAIAYALSHAKKGDMIILAGKGHEDYQEICGVKYPLDERVLIEQVWSERNTNEGKLC